jgi:hypothetical protein
MDSNDEQEKRVNEVAHFETLNIVFVAVAIICSASNKELRLKYHNHEVELNSFKESASLLHIYRYRNGLSDSVTPTTSANDNVPKDIRYPYNRQ